jgi:hypothetical protein
MDARNHCAQRTGAAVPLDGPQRFEASPAEHRTGEQSAAEANNQIPARASLALARHRRCNESARCGDGGDCKQSNQVCRYERPQVATSGPSSNVGRSPDPTTVFSGSVSSVIVRDRSEHELLAAVSDEIGEGSRLSLGPKRGWWVRCQLSTSKRPYSPSMPLSLCDPRAEKRIPEPAARSRTVCDTRISLGPASATMRAAT